MEHDEEIQAMRYADLWLAELGRVVPQHHAGGIVEVPYVSTEMRRRPVVPDSEGHTPPR